MAQTDQDPLLQQMAEQSIPLSSAFDNRLLDGTNEPGIDNDTYLGIKNFWNVDIAGNFFANIGHVIGRWFAELIDGWLAETVRFLTTYLRTFVLNPNILSGLDQNESGNSSTTQFDDISPFVQKGINVIYAIALDLLLILFILSIWRYWTTAAWHSGVSLFSAVGRLIFTTSIILAWRTLYSLEIQLSNEMIQAIYFHSADQIQMLDGQMGNLVKSGLVANSGLLAQSLGNVPDVNAVSSVGGAVGGLVSFVGLIIFLVFALVLIAQLLIILVLKAIQTALLAVQYMFAPFFLVFFATPDTASIASGYIKSFIEVSLWTFIWVGLLKIMTILLFASMSPWGKIVLAIGVMQLMIQAPSFLAQAKLSPLSSLVVGGLLNKNALSQALNLGHSMVSSAGRLIGESNGAGANGTAVIDASAPKFAWRTDAADSGMPLSVSVLKPLGLPRPALLSSALKRTSFATSAGTRLSDGAKLTVANKSQNFLEDMPELALARESRSSCIESLGKKPLADRTQIDKVQDGGLVSYLAPDGVEIDHIPIDIVGSESSVAEESCAVAGDSLADPFFFNDAFNSQTPLAPPRESDFPMENQSLIGQSESSLGPHQVLPDASELNSPINKEPVSDKSMIPGFRKLTSTPLTRPFLAVAQCVNPIALARCSNPDPTTNGLFLIDLIPLGGSDSSACVETGETEFSDATSNLHGQNGIADSNGSSNIATTARDFVREEAASSPLPETLKPSAKGGLLAENSGVRFSSVFLTTAESLAPRVSSDMNERTKSADTTQAQSEADLNQVAASADLMPVLRQNVPFLEASCQDRLDWRDDSLAMSYIASDLQAAGFQDYHLQNPQILGAMVELYEKNPALLYGGADPLILQSAALTANILPPECFTQDKILHVHKDLTGLT